MVISKMGEKSQNNEHDNYHNIILIATFHQKNLYIRFWCNLTCYDHEY